MATFTITTPVNIDTLASKAGNDVYNINGGYLTVDQDSRYGTNANTSATLGNITLSATLGGTVEFNSTAVRLIPYNTGSGVVPAYNTVISQGGASGKMIGVYANLTSAPTAPAAAMPASGFIKIKQTVGTFAAGALTGITATATGDDEPGWLEIVGADAGTCTVNRLNLFKVQGDFFYFRGVTTSGDNTTTYQLPTNGSITRVAGVWVETAVASDEYEFYPNAGTNYAHVDSIATDVRGKFCWVSTTGLVRFQNDGTYSSGGYLPPAGLRIRVPNIFFMNATTGAPTVNALPNATLATRYDFTTTGGGAIEIDKAMLNWYPSFAQPYSVALSNVGIMSQLAVSEIAAPVTWSQIGIGQEALNTQVGLSMATCFAGGTISNCTWTRATATSSGHYAVIMSDLTGFTINNNKSVVMASRGNANSGAYSLTRVNDSIWNNPIIGGGRVAITTCTNLVFDQTVYFDHLAWTTNYTAGPTLPATAWTRVTTTATATLTNHGLKVGDTFTVSATSDAAAIVNGAKTVVAVPTANTFTFACLNAGATSGTLSYTRTAAQIAVSAFDLASNCNNITINGFSFGGLTLVQPFSAILNIGAAGCSNIKLRNIGTWDSQLELGGVRQEDVAWTRATTVATVTSASHGLKVGDNIYVIVSSVIAAITVAAKVVTSVPTADTFTFACLNAGATSGTLSYYPVVTASVVTLAASAAANNVKVQRVYTDHTRTGIFSGDNSSKNILMESIFGDPVDSVVSPILNCTLRGIGATPTLAAQVSVYGTIWGDYYSFHIPPNTSGVSWTRATTTATVTSVGHRLRTGALINVTTTSDATAITRGVKTITAITADTFTFTCLNAGSASGTVDFQPFTGRIAITMNEATAETADQYTIDSGTPAFTSAGSLFMPVIGQKVTFVCPHYIIGHTSFPIAEAAMAGGTIANYNITYAIDKNDGSGYSAFKNLYYNRAGGSGTGGAFTFTVTDATGIAVNDYAFGTNVGINAKVTGIVGNTVTVDNANIGTVSGVIRFNHLPSETGINAALGFKMKVSIETIITNTTAISSLLYYTESTPTSRAYQYPLDTVAATLSLTGLMPNSEIRVFTTAGNVPLAGTENSGTSFEYDYTWSGTDENVYIVVHALGYNPIRFEGQVLGNEGLIIPVQQQLDRVYANA